MQATVFLSYSPLLLKVVSNESESENLHWMNVIPLDHIHIIFLNITMNDLKLSPS